MTELCHGENERYEGVAYTDEHFESFYLLDRRQNEFRSIKRDKVKLSTTLYWKQNRTIASEHLRVSCSTIAASDHVSRFD